MSNDITREQCILVKQMTSTILCFNAPFCDGGPAKNELWQNTTAKLIARDTSSIALENAISVLKKALIIAKITKKK